VQLEADPPVDEALLAALEPLVVAATRQRKRGRSDDVSAWRRAAARESVENDPMEAGYAPSPRSTRGATRA
jgi:hypothetical protein